MAETNALSLSNLEGVTVPPISQETTQQVTNDLSLSNLEGVEVAKFYSFKDIVCNFYSIF